MPPKKTRAEIEAEIAAIKLALPPEALEVRVVRVKGRGYRLTKDEEPATLELSAEGGSEVSPP